nr:MAG TPA: hypothetical protein [Caudoviricetes sp.]
MKYIYRNDELIASVYDEVPEETLAELYKDCEILDNEKTFSKEELYRQGKYTLAYNEIFEDNTIKTVELKPFEYIKDNQVVFNREQAIKYYESNIYRKEQQEKEKPFEFKGYMQPNRELQDQTSLLKVISLMQATKQTEFKDWKMYDTEDKEHYVTLTIQELMQLAMIMQQQTTRAMRIASKLREELVTLSDEDLKNYNLEEKWNNENK